MASMTPRRRQVLAAIDTLRRQLGYSPTVREIGQAVGLASSSTVHRYIDTLHQLGLVEHKGLPRTLRLTEAGRRELEEETRADQGATRAG